MARIVTRQQQVGFGQVLHMGKGIRARQTRLQPCAVLRDGALRIDRP
jgi:hypothetical protein